MEKTELELYGSLPVFSLQKMSLIRITTILCNNRQLLNLILKCKLEEYFSDRLYTRNGTEWKAVQKMANEMVSQICNCVQLSESIMALFWPVCYRIMLWKSIYEPSIGNQFLKRFYWTDQGRIHNKRTVKYIIGNRNISIRSRFVLACSVCLDKEIYALWGEMSNDDKRYFYAENSEKIRPLLLFWVHIIEGSADIFQQFKNSACDCAFDNGLIEAIKYIFVISTKDARNSMAYSYMLKLYYNKLDHACFLEEDEIDIGYFLFFEMTVEHRKFMSAFSGLELSLLLYFSEREYFLSVLEERIRSASGRGIVVFLLMVFYNYHLEVIQDDDYSNIFVDIWRTIPTSIRNDIADTHQGGQFLFLLIRDNFPFLLRKGGFKKMAELTSVDLKPRTSVTPFGFHQQKWELLHFLIKEEVVKIPVMKLHRWDLLLELKIIRSKKAVWNRVLRFVRKIGSKNRLPEE